MKLPKTNEGLLYTKISSLVTGLALLAIFLYQMLLNDVSTNGGTYPSGGMIIASMIMLIFGAVLGFYGAWLRHSRTGLVAPLVGAATLLSFFVQWEWCLRYCVVP